MSCMKKFCNPRGKKKKKKNKQFVIGAHPGIDPGPLVPKSDTISTRPRPQVMRISK